MTESQNSPTDDGDKGVEQIKEAEAYLNEATEEVENLLPAIEAKEAKRHISQALVVLEEVKDDV